MYLLIIIIIAKPILRTVYNFEKCFFQNLVNLDTKWQNSYAELMSQVANERPMICSKTPSVSARTKSR